MWFGELHMLFEKITVAMKSPYQRKQRRAKTSLCFSQQDFFRREVALSVPTSLGGSCLDKQGP